MSFGVPPRPEPAAPATGDLPTILVLTVLRQQGSFAAWQPLAGGTDRAQLESLFGQWLIRNQGNYGGQFKIAPIPFLLPPGTPR